MRKISLILIIIGIPILIWLTYSVDRYISISLLQIGWLLICYLIAEYRLEIKLSLLIAVLYSLNMMVFLSNKLAIFH